MDQNLRLEAVLSIDTYENRHSLFFTIGGESYGIGWWMPAEEADKLARFLHGKTFRYDKEVQMRDFGWALARLRDGFALARDSWKEPVKFISLDNPSESTPSLYMKQFDVGGFKSVYHRWEPTLDDILAENWTIIER